MTLDTSLFIDKQVPEHIRVAYPNFIKFLAAYYEFNDEILKPFADGKDIDKISENLLPFLRNELAKGFGKPLIDERKFLKNIRKLIERKGTFDAVELLFRLFYDDTVTVEEPNKRLLKSSDGKWYQNKFFHVEVPGGFTDIDNLFSFDVENVFGNFSVDIEKIEELEPNIFRVFVRNFNFLRLRIEDDILFRNKSGNLVESGFVIARPTKFVLDRPGKYWVPGQVIRVPGTVKDTLIRVVSTSGSGEIRSFEVFEHGYSHGVFQTIKESPFSGKPFDIKYDIDVFATGVNTTPDGNVVSYSTLLELRDSNQNIVDTVVGSYDGSVASPYFLEDYNSEDYGSGGAVELETESITNSFDINPPVSFPSLNNWVESLAFFYIDNQIITLDRGSYLDDSGKLSNDDIRLQDSFFFQLFSYVIETEIDIKDYRNTLDNIHPAGLIYFGSLRKVLFAEARQKLHSVTRELGNFYPNTSFMSIPDDSDRRFDMTKTLLDIGLTEEIVAKEINKYLESNATAVSTPIEVIDPGFYAIDYVDIGYEARRIIIGNT